MNTKDMEEYLAGLPPGEREEVAKPSLKVVKSPTQAEDAPHPYEAWKQLFWGTGYTVDRYGCLCRVKMGNKDKGEKESVVRMANFTAKISREVVRDDGQDRKMMFEIDGILKGGRNLPVALVPADKYTAMNWPVANWGAAANIIPGTATKDTLRYAIQTTGFDCPKEHIYTHTGWRQIGGKWVYIHGSGGIGADNVKVDLDEAKLMNYSLPAIELTQEAKQEAIRATLECLEIGPEEITWPLLATIFLGPLCEPMRKANCEPAFVLWMAGMTGARKSTITGLFLSHYGSFTGKALPGSFKDSENTLERKAFLLKDTVFCIDDFHPVGTQQEKRRIEKIAHSILRGYGDRVGRGRMNADTSLRETYIPRGLCVVTGEDVPNLGQSATSRMFTLELQRDAIDLDRLTVMQKKSHILADCMAGYIDWLRPQIDELAKRFKDLFPDLRHAAADKAAHGRIPETVASLYLGFSCMLSYFEAVKAITAAEKGSMGARAWELLVMLGERQGRMVFEDAPTEKFLTALQEMIAAKEVVIHNLVVDEMGETVSWDGKSSKENFIGWKDDLYYYLLPGMVYKMVCQFYQQQGGVFSVGQTTLWKHLESEGMIKTEQGGSQVRRVQNKRIPGTGKVVKVLWLKSDALKI